MISNEEKTNQIKSVSVCSLWRMRYDKPNPCSFSSEDKARVMLSVVEIIIKLSNCKIDCCPGGRK